MTRTEMLELHDKIKENIFRENPVLNAKYAKGYYEQMQQLARAFWEQVKDAKRRIRIALWEKYHGTLFMIFIPQIYG